MEQGFTAEQETLRARVRAVVEGLCPLDRVAELDRSGEFPDELWRALAREGVLGLPFPVEYGGRDGGVTDFAIVCEELAWGMMAASQMYTLSVLFGGEAVLYFGTEEQKRRYLPGICRGEFRFCGCLTEPEAGSDLASLTTTALPQGSGYRVRGRKIFSTGAHVADFALLLARSDPAGERHRGISAFVVDMRTPGITVQPLETLGCMPCHTNEVIFEDVEIPDDALLGERERGFYQILRLLDVERIVTGAMGIGLARRTFETALEWARERRQFGRPIGRFQAIQHKLAEVASEIHAARLAVYHAAAIKGAGTDCPREACMAKLLGTEAAKRAAVEGMQVMGGYGYLTRNPMQRFLREAVLGTIVAGTSEIMKNVIAGTYEL